MNSTITRPAVAAKHVVRNVRALIAIRAIYYLTATCLMVTGFGMLLGPDRWAASESLSVVRRMTSIDSWSLIFIGAGTLKCWLGHKSRRSYRIGSTVGGVVALMWAGGFIGAAVTGELIAWPAITSWLTIAGVQLVGSAAVWQR